MFATIIGISIIIVVGFWMAGGVVLRVGGLMWAVFGALILAIDHSLVGIVVFGFGFVLWLAGHWHYAVRYHAYKSPLAQRIFQQVLPARFDPSRGWGQPVVLIDPRSEPSGRRE
jgi:hypothetical protein